MSKSVVRHHLSFKPSKYQLFISIDHQALSFSGKVRIEGAKTGRPSNRIVLHQSKLRISKASLTKLEKNQTPKVIEIDRVNTLNRAQELRLHSKESLYPGKYIIEIEFSGQITGNLNGIYPSYYEQNGKKETIVTTQFESHHAREAFPCIDEPEAKAIFELILETDDLPAILSNTPAVERKLKAGRVTTVFAPSPLMSTYLLAFVVGNLSLVEAKTKRGISVRCFSTPDKVKQLDFALDTTVRALDFYENYFGIDFPLPKCDLVALPDFASGAMENWGLITFREVCLLEDPDHTSLQTKQYVAIVICHELAHQWFGNLVTMRWWTDLWLNEGFASWIEYLVADNLFPSWDLWTQFISGDQRVAFGLDALPNTHPIEVPINHPDEIRTIFDSISYNKGAAVIHMLHSYLGEKDFKIGLQHYLKKHAYGNTDTVDLWHALEEASGKPVRDFMSHWTKQSGFPIVSVNDDNVSQERFFLTHSALGNQDSSLWPVPLLRGESDREVFSTKSHKVSASGAINTSSAGFYVTKYSKSILAKLLASNTSKTIDEKQRLVLLYDLSIATKAGYEGTADLLDALLSYENESSSAVWDVLSSTLGDLKRVFADNPKIHPKLKDLIAHMVKAELGRLGWDHKTKETHQDSLLRPTILGMASAAGVKEVVDGCRHKFAQMKEPSDIHPDVRGVVYCTVAREGDQKTFDRLWELYLATESSEEKITLAAALTSFEDPKLIAKTLELIKRDEVRNQDIGYWVSYAFMNRTCKRLTWDWLKLNMVWLRETLGSELSYYMLPRYSARPWSDAKFIEEYKEFWLQNTEPALKRSIDQGLEQIQWQASWKERDEEVLSNWLDSHKFN